MAKIFISYRREDSRWPAHKLYDTIRPLVSDPDNDVFIDVDNIPLGVNFFKHLDGKVSQCEYLLAVIGPHWLSVTNPETGARRLDDPADFVRIEIAAALKRGIPVIPVLMDGARLPAPLDLPEDLRELPSRQGVEVRHLSFENDVERLLAGIGLEPDKSASGKTSRRGGLIDRPNFDPARFVFIAQSPQIRPEVPREVIRGLIASGMPVWVSEPRELGLEPTEFSSLDWERSESGHFRSITDAVGRAKCLVSLIGKTRAARGHLLRAALEAGTPVVAAVVDEVSENPMMFEGPSTALHEALLPESLRGRHVPTILADELGEDRGRNGVAVLVHDALVAAEQADGRRTEMAERWTWEREAESALWDAEDKRKRVSFFWKVSLAVVVSVGAMATALLLLGVLS